MAKGYFQKRNALDILAKNGMFVLSASVSLLILLISLGLFIKARPILANEGIGKIIFSLKWHPSHGQFGLAPFILGTVWVTAVAMFLAVPASVFTAIYMATYAPKRAREFIKPILDLLSGISPVIFGVFGVLIVVPFVGDYLMPLSDKIWGLSWLLHSDNFTGFGILSGGIVLAIMVFPVMTQVCEEVIHSIPREMTESSLALGATRWETIRYVILRKALPGVIAAVILGLSRAFGETIAVLMVVGNVVQVPKSLFDAAYTLPALIANNYGEMMSIPLYDSALMLAALILLAVTVFFNVLAWSILLRIEREYV